MLLNAGADVMAQNKWNSTPLHWAAAADKAENIKTLLEAGADVNAQIIGGVTPLHLAANCRLCDPSVIQSLLAAGGDAKVKADDGKTPWDLAQENDKLKDTKAYWALNNAQYN